MQNQSITTQSRYWIVDEDGVEHSIERTNLGKAGVEIWSARNGRHFSLSDDRTSAQAVQWDRVEGAYEVTGEFDLHARPFLGAQVKML